MNISSTSPSPLVVTAEAREPAGADVRRDNDSDDKAAAAPQKAALQPGQGTRVDVTA